MVKQEREPDFMRTTEQQVLDSISAATTEKDILEATCDSISRTGYFWEGDSDEFVWALGEDWSITFLERSYYCVATDQDGTRITFSEGDIYPGVDAYTLGKYEDVLIDDKACELVRDEPDAF